MTEETLQLSDFKRERLKQRSRYIAVFVALALAFCVIVVLNINTGSVNISIGEIVDIIFFGGGEKTVQNIVWEIRMPRILMAAVLGGALALSGFLLQVFFNNPIASPFILGLSAGARMAVAAVMVVLIPLVGTVSSYTLISAAFVGSLISVALILLISRRIDSMSTLLIAGVMISYICGAVTDFIINFAADSDIANLHGWSQGSFSGMSWSNVQIAYVVILIALVCTFMLSKPIGAYQMGESYAQSMGVNVKIFRTVLILLASLFAATVAAFAGPISFVGIAVPHLVKLALKTARPLVMIPATFLGGAIFCMICDLIARMAFAPLELDVSTVTALFGAPVVIWMLISRKKETR